MNFPSPEKRHASAVKLVELARVFQAKPDSDFLIDALGILPDVAVGNLEAANTYFWRINACAIELGQQRDAAWRVSFRNAAADAHYRIVDHVRGKIGDIGVHLDKSSNTVVFIMHQMLIYPHAPTLYCDKLGRFMEKHEGFEYILINGNQLPLNREPQGFGGIYFEKLATQGFARARLNVRDDTDQYVTAFFTPPTDPMSLTKLREIYAFLRALKPRAVVGYGGSNLAADVLAPDVPVICHPSVLTPVATRGYAVVDYCAHHGGHGLAGSSPARRPVSVRYRPFTETAPEAESPFDWTRFDLPADARVLALPGNRLQSEVTAEFEEGLARFLEAVPDVDLVLLGRWHYEPRTDVFKAMKSRWRTSEHLPLQDYLNAVGSAEAMMDTPAPGNATAALTALLSERPVFCLSDMDNGLLFAVDGLPDSPSAMIDEAIAYFTNPDARRTWDERVAWWARVRKPELAGEGVTARFHDVIDAAESAFAAISDGGL